MISLKFKSTTLKFNPGITSTLITLLLLPLFVYLGFWQIHRMTEKQILQTKLQHHQAEDPEIFDEHFEKKILATKDNPHYFETSKTLSYQKLRITGKFLNNIQILLDNQMFKGQAGYHILTAFQPTGSQFIILVNRGWVKMGFDRSKLPHIPAIPGEVTLSGLIHHPSVGLKLPSLFKNPPPQKALHESMNLGPLRIQTIDFKELSTLISDSLIPLLLQLPKENPYSFEVLPIDFDDKISRHLGYAVQWFIIAAATLIYYLVINIHRDKTGDQDYKTDSSTRAQTDNRQC